MIGWLLLLGGALFAATGMTLAVGTMSVSRVELYRWVSHRLARGGPPSAVLAVPARILGAANAIAAVGVIVAAFGVMALVAPLPFWLGSATVVLVAVPLLMIVAYAVPRVLGQRWAEPIVKTAVPWLHRVAAIFAPLAPTGSDARPRATLAAFLESDEESLDTRELLGVLLGVLSFTERPVREIMTPRTDIVAVREGAGLEEVGQLFAEARFSRVPVYRESLDHIIGMISALDLLKVSPGAELPLRPVTVAPASKRCADLLFEMQRDRRQFAVVLDEFGGTAGIATFQDLLEELVAEIFSDTNGRSDGGSGSVEVIEVTGATACDEIEARFELTLPPQAETVGGLLARAAGRIPQAGERYIIGELEFDVLAATATRVERIVVRRGPVPMVHLGGGR
jgi:CBS domain containing-hemolysin-like protein